MMKTKPSKTSSSSLSTGTIKPAILVDMAVKNLLAKRLRSLLTIGGIVIGVGAIVFLVSLAQGLQQTVNRYVIGSQSVKAIDVTSPNSETVPLSIDKVKRVREFANINEVESSYVIPGKVADRGSLTDAVIYGSNNQYIRLSALGIVAGKSTLQDEKDVIVSASLLDLIGQPSAQAAIGHKISIETTLTLPNGTTKDFKDTLKIVGVADIGTGVAVYMNGKPFATAGMTDYGQVKVVANMQEDVATIREQISGLGLTTASPLDTLNEIESIFSIFTVIVIGFGGIGVVIAILGMFNTLTISLLERTSEIGLMITMGARKADVQKLLIIEALVLSLLGGIGGIVAAWSLGFFINAGITYFAHERGMDGWIGAFQVTPFHVVMTLFFVVIVGYIVALYPSRQAARVNPIEVLRNN